MTDKKQPAPTVIALPNKQNITRIRYHIYYNSFCSIGKLPFKGRVKITFDPGEKILEFMSFDDWLRVITKEETTIEELNSKIYFQLRNLLHPKNIRVVITATTDAHGYTESEISTYEGNPDNET